MGRVKEMDLTSEQHEKMMALIDQAKAEENSGNKARALKIYIQLQKFLQGIEQDKNVDHNKIKKQLEYVDQAIADLMTNEEIDENSKKSRFTVLVSQKKIIRQPLEDKTEIVPKKDVKIEAKTIPTEANVLELICVLASLPGPEWDKIYIIHKAVDEHGMLLSLNVGIAGRPDTEYNYILAGSFKDIGSSMETGLARLELDPETGSTVHGVQVARYDESKKDWDIIDI